MQYKSACLSLLYPPPPPSHISIHFHPPEINEIYRCCDSGVNRKFIISSFHEVWYWAHLKSRRHESWVFLSLSSVYHYQSVTLSFLPDSVCRNSSYCLPQRYGVIEMSCEPTNRHRNIVSWKPEGHYHYSKMFNWEPEGHYPHRLCTVIAPFWFSTKTCLNVDIAYPSSS